MKEIRYKNRIIGNLINNKTEKSNSMKTIFKTLILAIATIMAFSPSVNAVKAPAPEDDYICYIDECEEYCKASNKSKIAMLHCFYACVIEHKEVMCPVRKPLMG